METVQHASEVDKGANGCAHLTSAALEGRLGIRRAAPARALFISQGTGTVGGAEPSPPVLVRGLGGSAPVILNRKPTNPTSTGEDKRRAVVEALRRAGRVGEANAVASCGAKSVSFECEGQLTLLEAGASHVSHRVEKRLYCQRPYCPTCGEDGSAAHRRKAARLAENIYGIRIAKWVVTLPPEDRELLPVGREARDDVSEMMAAVADVVARFHATEAAMVAVHWFGDKGQGMHFEVIIPHAGEQLPKADLHRMREELAERLQTQRLPVAQFQYIGTALGETEQARLWWHKTRYACHPTIGAERVASMESRELRGLVEMVAGFRTIRGYGLWGDRKIKASRELLTKLYPMPDAIASDRVADVELFDGAPCPADGCSCTLTHRGIVAASEYGVEIAPGITLHTVERWSPLDAAELGTDILSLVPSIFTGQSIFAMRSRDGGKTPLCRREGNAKK